MDIKLNIKTLAAYMDMSVAALAEKADLNVHHLNAVMAGRAKMTGDDLVALSNVTGIPMENIETRLDKQ